MGVDKPDNTWRYVSYYLADLFNIHEMFFVRWAQKFLSKDSISKACRYSTCHTRIYRFGGSHYHAWRISKGLWHKIGNCHG